MAITAPLRGDSLLYEVSLTPAQIKKVDHVRVTVYSQSIPPTYLQERFRDANVGPAKNNEIRRLYFITSRLNVDMPKDRTGQPFMAKWKLKIAGPAVATIR